MVNDRLPVCINNARSSRTVGVDEVGIRIGFIIRAFRIAVTERGFDDRQRRTLLPFPFSLDSPSRYAASIVAFILAMVFLSDFGIMSDTENFGVPPLIDLAS